MQIFASTNHDGVWYAIPDIDPGIDKDGRLFVIPTPVGYGKNRKAAIAALLDKLKNSIEPTG